MEQGSIVWAKMTGYPWWPAIVDVDPDYDSFYWPKELKKNENPTEYHVVFLDEKLSRLWVNCHSICLFKKADTSDSMGPHVCKGKDYSSKVIAAFDRAKVAIHMRIEERINTFGLAVRLPNCSFYESQSDGDVHVHLYPAPERKRRRKRLVKRMPKKTKNVAENQASSSGADDGEPPAKTLDNENNNSDHQDGTPGNMEDSRKRRPTVNSRAVRNKSSSSSTSLELVG